MLTILPELIPNYCFLSGHSKLRLGCGALEIAMKIRGLSKDLRKIIESSFFCMRFLNHIGISNLGIEEISQDFSILRHYKILKPWVENKPKRFNNIALKRNFKLENQFSNIDTALVQKSMLCSGKKHVLGVYKEDGGKYQLWASDIEGKNGIQYAFFEIENPVFILNFGKNFLVACQEQSVISFKEIQVDSQITLLNDLPDKINIPKEASLKAIHYDCGRLFIACGIKTNYQIYTYTMGENDSWKEEFKVFSIFEGHPFNPCFFREGSKVQFAAYQLHKLGGKSCLCVKTLDYV